MAEGNKRISIILYLFLGLILVVFLINFSGCRSEKNPQESTGGNINNSEKTSENEASQTENSPDNEGNTGTNTDSEQYENGDDTPGQDSGDIQEIPQQILNLISEGDLFYENGEYGNAAKSYRDVEIAIDEEGLEAEAADALRSQFAENYQDAVYRVDTARTHHGVAMQLQYEKRFEEAKTELEKALEIYPKYQDAINALESLETLMGLSS